MAAAAGPYYLAKTGTTGNSASTDPGIDAPKAAGPTVFQFVCEALGGTPTVTFKYQGSMDGTNWYDLVYVTDGTAAASVATRTLTSGTAIQFLESLTDRMYRKYRCVTTSNTNVTYRAELYQFEVSNDTA